MDEKYSISLYPGTGTVPGGISGDHILIAPAYNVTREDIEEIAERTTRVLNSYFADLKV
jgi:adenosylmethionine-8-amino-7-oxononanoate aminotransferase